jgi:hypothetical protein
MTRHDEERLFQLISNTCTTRVDPRQGDPRQLAGLPPKFRKVMPVEYRRAFVVPLPEKEVKTQAGGRCMDCGIPYCHGPNGCPVNNQIPDWNDLVYKGDWDRKPRATCTRPTTSRNSPAASALPRARKPAR